MDTVLSGVVFCELDVWMALRRGNIQRFVIHGATVQRIEPRLLGDKAKGAPGFMGASIAIGLAVASCTIAELCDDCVSVVVGD